MNLRGRNQQPLERTSRSSYASAAEQLRTLWLHQESPRQGAGFKPVALFFFPVRAPLRAARRRIRGFGLTSAYVSLSIARNRPLGIQNPIRSADAGKKRQNHDRDGEIAAGPLRFGWFMQRNLYRRSKNSTPRSLSIRRMPGAFATFDIIEL